jgi:hypothetical protein
MLLLSVTRAAVLLNESGHRSAAGNRGNDAASGPLLGVSNSSDPSAAPRPRAGLRLAPTAARRLPRYANCEAGVGAPFGGSHGGIGERALLFSR